MAYLIISCSLHPESKSRILAKELEKHIDAECIDLREVNLPFCDGHSSYGDKAVVELHHKIQHAKGIILATPIYNYNTNAVLKNLIELTGKAWEHKVVGFLCAAGGKSSYMSVLPIANGLMLDFRCVIIPKFVYATGADFANGVVEDEHIVQRIKELGESLETFCKIVG